MTEVTWVLIENIASYIRKAMMNRIWFYCYIWWDTRKWRTMNCQFLGKNWGKKRANCSSVQLYLVASKGRPSLIHPRGSTWGLSRVANPSRNRRWALEWGPIVLMREIRFLQVEMGRGYDNPMHGGAKSLGRRPILRSKPCMWKRRQEFILQRRKKT